MKKPVGGCRRAFLCLRVVVVSEGFDDRQDHDHHKEHRRDFVHQAKIPGTAGIAAFTEFLEWFPIRVVPGSELLDHIPIPSTKHIDHAVKELNSVILGIIQKRRAEPNAEGGDFLSILMHAVDEEGDGSKMTDEQLRDKTTEFRTRIADGELLDDLLVETFAVVREASWRSVRMRHFDVQLIGGIALFHGAIAEMDTGEGKTLTATLPVYLRALMGRGVHLATVNVTRHLGRPDVHER